MKKDKQFFDAYHQIVAEARKKNEMVKPEHVTLQKFMADTGLTYHPAKQVLDDLTKAGRLEYCGRLLNGIGGRVHAWVVVSGK